MTADTKQANNPGEDNLSTDEQETEANQAKDDERSGDGVVADPTDADLVVHEAKNKAGEEQQKPLDSMQNVPSALPDATVLSQATIERISSDAKDVMSQLSSKLQEVNNMTARFRSINGVILGTVMMLMLLGLASGGYLVYLLQSTFKDAAAINVAVAKKVVDFEDQMDRVVGLESQLVRLTDINNQLGQHLMQMVTLFEQVNADAEARANSQAELGQDALAQVTERISSSFAEAELVSQKNQTVLKTLQQRTEALEKQLKNLQNQDLVGKMEALIALEQQRYYQLEQAKLQQRVAETSADLDNFITFGGVTKSQEASNN